MTVNILDHVFADASNAAAIAEHAGISLRQAKKAIKEAVNAGTVLEAEGLYTLAPLPESTESEETKAEDTEGTVEAVTTYPVVITKSPKGVMVTVGELGALPEHAPTTQAACRRIKTQLGIVNHTPTQKQFDKDWRVGLAVMETVDA